MAFELIDSEIFRPLQHLLSPQVSALSVEIEIEYYVSTNTPNVVRPAVPNDPYIRASRAHFVH